MDTSGWLGSLQKISVNVADDILYLLDGPAWRLVLNNRSKRILRIHNFVLEGHTSGRRSWSVRICTTSVVVESEYTSCREVEGYVRSSCVRPCSSYDYLLPELGCSMSVDAVSSILRKCIGVPIQNSIKFFVVERRPSRHYRASTLGDSANEPLYQCKICGRLGVTHLFLVMPIRGKTGGSACLKLSMPQVVLLVDTIDTRQDTFWTIVQLGNCNVSNEFW
jgi:hypothetical protein